MRSYPVKTWSLFFKVFNVFRHLWMVATRQKYKPVIGMAAYNWILISGYDEYGNELVGIRKVRVIRHETKHNERWHEIGLFKWPIIYIHDTNEEERIAKQAEKSITN